MNCTPSPQIYVDVLNPVLVNETFFGTKRVFADVINEESSWVNQTGPKSNSNVLIMRGEDKTKEKFKAKAEIGVTLPQVKKYQELEEVKKKNFSPECRGNMPC